MGNKSSADGNRRHSVDGVLSTDDYVSEKKKSDKKKQNSSRKSSSMYVKNADDWIDSEPTKPADVKIYRSTSTGDDIQRRHRQNDGPDVRVYRRSAAGPTFVNGESGDSDPKLRHSSSTLPRNFGRKTITVVEGRTLKDGDFANDSQLSDARPGTGPTTPVYSSIQRPSSRTSIRVGNVQTSAAAAAVTLADFPDTESVKRRLYQFENRFVERFTALYSALPETVQLSALSIAVRRRSSHPAAYYGDLNDHVISLWHYLRPPTHSDLQDHELPVEEFALTIHPELFRRLQLYRIESTNNAMVNGDGNAGGGGCSLTDLVRDLVWSIAAEAAITISTAFEYQIGLLGDGLPCQLLADRAADCTIDFLKKTNRHLDVNALASGVIRGRPADVRVATVSVVIGQKELKWNIDEILFRPGLRKDTLLTAVDATEVSRRYSTPWRFYTSTVPGVDEFIDPNIYGYRGQLLHRDFEAVETLRSGTSQPFYRVDADEEHLYNIEVMWRADDFHRLYIPYRRFVGMALLDAYTARTAQNVWNSTGLVEYIQNLTKSSDAGKSHRDIEPVVRPLSLLRDQQLQRPPTNGIRPRCVSDAEEFSRQQTFRQTWCPGGTVAAAAATRRHQNTAANDYRPLSSTPAAPASSSAYPQSSLVNSPITVDSAYSTASTTAGVVVIDRSISPPLAHLNTSGYYRDSPVPQTAPVISSSQFNSSRQPPDLLPVRTVVDGNDNFVTPPSSGVNNVVRRSFASASSTSTEQPTPASPHNDSGDNKPSGNNYFPTLDQLFGKQLRAMKSKTIHVTEFPIDESNFSSTDNSVEKPTRSVETSLVKKEAVSTNYSSTPAYADNVFYEDRQQNGAIRSSMTSPTPASAAAVVAFKKPPPPPVKPRTKSLLSSTDATTAIRQSFADDVTPGNDLSDTMSGLQSPTAAMHINGYGMTISSVPEVETFISEPKSLIISDI